MGALVLENNSLNVVNGGLLEAIENFLIDREVKANSKEQYRKALFNFISYLKENGIATPSKETIREYKTLLLNNYKRVSASNIFKIVKMFFRWLAGEGLYSDIARNIKTISLDTEDHRSKYLNDKDIAAIISTLPTSSAKDKRNLAIFYLLLTTGIRASELLNINIEDIKEQDGFNVLYIKGKGRTSKNEFVKLPFKTLQLIEAYLLTRGTAEPTEPLFTATANKNTKLSIRGLEKIIDSIYKRAGVEGGCVHTLRHTAITQALKEGASLQEAKELARHKNLNTTLIYSHNINLLNNSASERLADKYL